MVSIVVEEEVASGVVVREEPTGAEVEEATTRAMTTTKMKVTKDTPTSTTIEDMRTKDHTTMGKSRTETRQRKSLRAILPQQQNLKAKRSEREAIWQRLVMSRPRFKMGSKMRALELGSLNSLPQE